MMAAMMLYCGRTVNVCVQKASRGVILRMHLFHSGMTTSKYRIKIYIAFDYLFYRHVWQSNELFLAVKRRLLTLSVQART